MLSYIRRGLDALRSFLNDDALATHKDPPGYGLYSSAEDEAAWRAARERAGQFDESNKNQSTDWVR